MAFRTLPPNTLGATIAYDPENVTNDEVGIKSELADLQSLASGNGKVA